MNLLPIILKLARPTPWAVGADDKFKSFVTSFIQAETNINSHSNALIVDVHVVQEKMNDLKLRKAAKMNN